MKKTIIKIISAVLIATFVAQDIAWANPDMGRRVPAQGTLQVPSIFGMLRADDIRPLVEIKLQEIIRTIPLEELKERGYRLVVEIKGRKVEINFGRSPEGKLTVNCSVPGDPALNFKFTINDNLEFDDGTPPDLPHLPSGPGKGKVYILNAGGTMDASGEVSCKPNGSVDALVANMRKSIYSKENLFKVPLDSSDIEPREWRIMLEKIKAVIDEKRADSVAGIGITHGTDTLDYSSFVAALEFKGKLPFPIVFTCSRVPPDVSGSDAPQNFKNLIDLIMSGKLPNDVFVVVRGRIYMPSQLKKVRTDPEAINNPYFEGTMGDYGSVSDEGVVEFDMEKYRQSQSAEALPELTGSSAGFGYAEHLIVNSRTPVYIYQDAIRRLKEDGEPGRTGLIMEGDFSNSRKINAIAKELEDAANKGITILVDSRSAFNRLSGQNIVLLPDSLSCEKAYTKYLWLLYKGVGPGSIGEEMQRNYCGEITGVALKKKQPKWQDSIKVEPGISWKVFRDARLRATEDDLPIHIEGFGDGNLPLGEESIFERVYQYLEKPELAIIKRGLDEKIKSSGKTNFALSRLVSVLARVVNRLDDKTLQKLYAHYIPYKYRPGATRGLSYIFAKRIIKNSLMYSNPVLCEIGMATDGLIRVTIGTNVTYGKTDTAKYELGNMLLAVGVDSDVRSARDKAFYPSGETRKLRRLLSRAKSYINIFFENQYPEEDNKFRTLTWIKLGIGIVATFTGFALPIIFDHNVSLFGEYSWAGSAFLWVTLVILKNIFVDLLVGNKVKSRWSQDDIRRRKLANDLFVSGVSSIPIIAAKMLTDSASGGNIALTIFLNIVVVTIVGGFPNYYARKFRRFDEVTAKWDFPRSFIMSISAYIFFGAMFMGGAFQVLVPSAIAFAITRKIIGESYGGWLDYRARKKKLEKTLENGSGAKPAPTGNNMSSASSESAELIGNWRGSNKGQEKDRAEAAEITTRMFARRYDWLHGVPTDAVWHNGYTFITVGKNKFACGPVKDMQAICTTRLDLNPAIVIRGTRFGKPIILVANIRPYIGTLNRLLWWLKLRFIKDARIMVFGGAISQISLLKQKLYCVEAERPLNGLSYILATDKYVVQITIKPDGSEASEVIPWSDSIQPKGHAGAARADGKLHPSSGSAGDASSAKIGEDRSEEDSIFREAADICYRKFTTGGEKKLTEYFENMPAKEMLGFIEDLSDEFRTLNINKKVDDIVNSFQVKRIMADRLYQLYTDPSVNIDPADRKMMKNIHDALLMDTSFSVIYDLFIEKYQLEPNSEDKIVNISGVNPKIKMVVMDWDGTVVKTLPCVRYAWGIIYTRIMKGRPADYAPSEEEKTEGKRFARSTTGKSLYEQLEYLVREARKRKAGNLKTVSYYAEEFGRLLLKAVKERRRDKLIMKETLEFLKELRRMGFKGKIIQTSGTPHNALVELVNYMGLADIFDDICGTYPRNVRGVPHNKAELIAALKKEYHLSGDEIVMIGDGIFDVKEAKIGGAVAVAIVPRAKAEKEFISAEADLIIRSHGVDKEIIPHLGMEFGGFSKGTPSLSEQPDNIDKSEAPNMARGGPGKSDTSSAGDFTNPYIILHIEKGDAVELDAENETVRSIVPDKSSPRSPPLEAAVKENGTFAKIKSAKDPELLKTILVKGNFRNLSAEEKEKLIDIVKDITVSFILGEVIIGKYIERDGKISDIFAHVRTGYSKGTHGLASTVWIGEILFNRLTVEEIAQLLLEECQHVLKKEKELPDGRRINLHGKIGGAKNPAEVIEHDQEFIKSLDLSPVKSKERALSLKKVAIKARRKGKNEAKKCLELAGLFQKDGDLEKAEEYYRKAILEDFTFAPAYVGLADVLRQMLPLARTRLILAMQLCAKALRRDPKIKMAHYILGTIYMGKEGGCYSKENARSEFTKELEINPDLAPAHYVLSQILVESASEEDRIQARHHILEAVRLDHNYLELLRDHIEEMSLTTEEQAMVRAAYAQEIADGIDKFMEDGADDAADLNAPQAAPKVNKTLEEMINVHLVYFEYSYKDLMALLKRAFNVEEDFRVEIMQPYGQILLLITDIADLLRSALRSADDGNVVMDSIQQDSFTDKARKLESAIHDVIMDKTIPRDLKAKLTSDEKGMLLKILERLREVKELLGISDTPEFDPPKFDAPNMSREVVRRKGNTQKRKYVLSLLTGADSDEIIGNIPIHTGVDHDDICYWMDRNRNKIPTKPNLLVLDAHYDISDKDRFIDMLLPSNWLSLRRDLFGKVYWYVSPLTVRDHARRYGISEQEAIKRLAKQYETDDLIIITDPREIDNIEGPTIISTDMDFFSCAFWVEDDTTIKSYSLESSETNKIIDSICARIADSSLDIAGIDFTLTLGSFIKEDKAFACYWKMKEKIVKAVKKVADKPKGHAGAAKADEPLYPSSGSAGEARSVAEQDAQRAESRMEMGKIVIKSMLHNETRYLDMLGLLSSVSSHLFVLLMLPDPVNNKEGIVKDKDIAKKMLKLSRRAARIRDTLVSLIRNKEVDYSNIAKKLTALKKKLESVKHELHYIEPQVLEAIDQIPADIDHTKGYKDEASWHIFGDIERAVDMLQDRIDMAEGRRGTIHEVCNIGRLFKNDKIYVHKFLGDVQDVDVPNINALRLLEAVENLITNARQHGNAQKVEVSVREKDGCCEIEVKDDGKGIEPWLLEEGDMPGRLRIFELGKTTRKDGREGGLGGALVWHFVRDSGGTIDVKSSSASSGRGTTFTIRLPLAIDKPRGRVGAVGRIDDVSPSSGSAGESKQELFRAYLMNNKLWQYQYLRGLFTPEIIDVLLSDPVLRPVFLQVLPYDKLGPLEIADPETLEKIGGAELLLNHSAFLAGAPQIADHLAKEGKKIIVGVTDRYNIDTLFQPYRVANGRQAYFPLRDGTWLGIKGAGQFSQKGNAQPAFYLNKRAKRYEGLAWEADAQAAKYAMSKLKGKGGRFVQFLGYRRTYALPDSSGGFITTNGLTDPQYGYTNTTLIFNRVLDPHRALKFPQLIKTDRGLKNLLGRISRVLVKLGKPPVLSSAEMMIEMAREWGKTEAIKQNHGLFKYSLHWQDLTIAGEESDNEETLEPDAFAEVVKRNSPKNEVLLFDKYKLYIGGVFGKILVLIDMLKFSRKLGQNEALFPCPLSVLKSFFEGYFGSLEDRWLQIWISEGADRRMLLELRLHIRLELFHPDNTDISTNYNFGKVISQFSDVVDEVYKWAAQEAARRRMSVASLAAGQLRVQAGMIDVGELRKLLSEVNLRLDNFLKADPLITLGGSAGLLGEIQPVIPAEKIDDIDVTLDTSCDVDIKLLAQDLEKAINSESKDGKIKAENFSFDRPGHIKGTLYIGMLPDARKYEINFKVRNLESVPDKEKVLKAHRDSMAQKFKDNGTIFWADKRVVDPAKDPRKFILRYLTYEHLFGDEDNFRAIAKKFLLISGKQGLVEIAEEIKSSGRIEALQNILNITTAIQPAKAGTTINIVDMTKDNINKFGKAILEIDRKCTFEREGLWDVGRFLEDARASTGTPLEDKWKFSALALHNGKPVGYIVAIRGNKDYPYSLGSIFVFRFAVHPDYRGKGIGRMLLHEVAQRTKSAGIEKMSLETWAGNPDAHRLYERVGFKRVGTHERKRDETFTEFEYEGSTQEILDKTAPETLSADGEHNSSASKVALPENGVVLSGPSQQTPFLQTSYRDFNEALRVFRRRQIRWARTTKDIRREFVCIMAKERGKEPSAISTTDFDAPIKAFNWKTLSGLLRTYADRGKLTPTEALDSLMQDLGIEKIIIQPYRDFNEALEVFRNGTMRWARATTDIRREFICTMARELGKAPGAISTINFEVPIKVFNGKSLYGLLKTYTDRGNLTPTEALDSLMQNLGIEKKEMPIQPYRDFNEALGVFRNGRINWARTTKDMRREFVCMMAKERGKEPGAISTTDFNVPIKAFNGKRPLRLLKIYTEEGKLTFTEALDSLMQDLGIEKIATQPYRDFNEALEVFRNGRISWTRTTKDIRREFVCAMAKDLGKEPGAISTTDFNTPIKVFNEKRLFRLLDVYIDKGKLTHAEALDSLMQDLGIEKIETQWQWQEKKTDWNRVCAILGETMSVQLTPANVKDYLKDVILSKEADIALGREVVLGDGAARETLILAYEKLVRDKARRLASRNRDCTEDELYSEGMHALIGCVERFDPSRNVALGAFINGSHSPSADRRFIGRIEGAMWDYMRKRRGTRRKNKIKEFSYNGAGTQDDADGHAGYMSDIEDPNSAPDKMSGYDDNDTRRAYGKGVKPAPGLPRRDIKNLTPDKDNPVMHPILPLAGPATVQDVQGVPTGNVPKTTNNVKFVFAGQPVSSKNKDKIRNLILHILDREFFEALRVLYNLTPDKQITLIIMVGGEKADIKRGNSLREFYVYFGMKSTSFHIDDAEAAIKQIRDSVINGYKRQNPPRGRVGAVGRLDDVSPSSGSAGEARPAIETSDKLADMELKQLIKELQDERRQIREIHSKWREAITTFGSARIPQSDPMFAKAKEFGAAIYRAGFAIRTGAGPSLMEAPLQGYVEERDRAQDGKSANNMTQGIRITLPFEQKTSKYVEDNYIFKHFINRKKALYDNCRGIAVFPGGFGTMDELLEVWFRKLPVVLIGKDYWEPMINTIYDRWSKLGWLEKVESRPFITDSVDEAVAYLKSAQYRAITESSEAVEKAGEDIELSLTELGKWPAAVTIIGQSEITDKKETDIVTRIASYLISSGVPVRSGTANSYLKATLESAAKDRKNMLQAVLAVPAGTVVTPAKNKIFTNDISNHHVLLAENSRAFVFLPGRVKTLSRLFDLIAIMQTGKVPKRPIVLIGREFWQPIKDEIVKAALDYPSSQLIKPEDAGLLQIADTAAEALKCIGFAPQGVLDKISPKLACLEDPSSVAFYTELVLERTTSDRERAGCIMDLELAATAGIPAAIQAINRILRSVDVSRALKTETILRIGNEPGADLSIARNILNDFVNDCKPGDEALKKIALERLGRMESSDAGSTGGNAGAVDIRSKLKESSGSVDEELINNPHFREMHRKYLLKELQRMQIMFTAYQEILSDYGNRTRALVDGALADMNLFDPSKEAFARSEELTAIMPDPAHIDIEAGGEKNWINWFDLANCDAINVNHIGYGCRWPCHQCLRGNGTFKARYYPLPILIERITRHPLGTNLWYANEPFEWRDPFFGVGIDAIFGFMVCKNRLTSKIVTKGWDMDDRYTQGAAQRCANILSEVDKNKLPEFILSFHMFGSRYNIIKDIYENGGDVSDDLIEIYAERYANIIRTIGPRLTLIAVYMVGNPKVDEATVRCLARTLGKDESYVRGKVLNRPNHKYSYIGDFPVQVEDIKEDGRGKDFIRRIEAAERLHKGCLHVDSNSILDRNMAPHPFPVTEISNSGQVVVRSVKNPEKILVQSHIDKLDPIEDAHSAAGQETAQTGAREPVHFLRNIVDTKELSQNMVEEILSALFSNKKPTFAFSKKLKGLESRQLLLLVEQLKRWKETTANKNPKMKKLLDNFTVFTYDDLATELNTHSIDANDKDGLIFTYEPKPEEEAAKLGSAIKRVYITEPENGFSADYYYPLLEMVTVSVAKELLGWDKQQLKDAMTNSGITADVFGIEPYIDDKTGILIFKVLSKMERYENNSRIDRYTRLLQFLHSA